MVTVDVIEGAWRGVIASHVAGLSFLSMWEPPLDDDQSITYPSAWWRPLTTGIVQPLNRVGRADTFNIDVLFIDQTSSDRNQTERDAAHAKMDAIAKQCWLRFVDLYIDNTNTFQGVTLDLEPSDLQFQPIWDEAPHHVTGVRMTVTLTAVAYDDCLDNYFTT